MNIRPSAIDANILEENRNILAETAARNRRLQVDAVVAACILRASAALSLVEDGEKLYPFTPAYVNSGMPAGVPAIRDVAELRSLMDEALSALSPWVDWRGSLATRAIR